MKFKVGEICECISAAGYWKGWTECTIVRIQNVRTEPYVIETGFKSPHHTGLWSADDSILRKKTPPREDNQAGDWKECPFIPEDLREEVLA